MDQQEYLKSSITSNDELNTKKYSFGLQRKNCLSKQMISYLYARSNFEWNK